MHAEIITIGDEILIGQTVDTNSAWIAEKLHHIGIRTVRIVSISDSPIAITRAIDEAFANVSLVLMTGGLGPTQDDITKETLAEYFHTRLEINEEVLAKITAYYESTGRPMLESNIAQAALPKNAAILKNSRGTAMGMWFEKDGKILISMPGVPHEMKGIMADHVLPMFQSRFSASEIIHKNVLTQGIGESFLAEKISDWETSLRNEGISLAYLPSAGIVKLRLSAYPEADKVEHFNDRISHYIKELERRVPEYVFGYDNQSLASVLGDLLQESGQTISAAESCTGGSLAQAITAVPGSSAYFKGSVVAYSNEAKVNLLGVDARLIEEYGAVSEEVVRAMAEGARKTFGSTYALATTGIAGPGGDSEKLTIGTVWMAIAGSEKTLVQKKLFGKNRSVNILFSSNTLLNWLRREIILKGFE